MLRNRSADELFYSEGNMNAAANWRERVRLYEVLGEQSTFLLDDLY